MMDYSEKKLEPKTEMSKKFLEKYMSDVQFVKNNFGDVAVKDPNAEVEEGGWPEDEDIMKALKRIKAV